MTVAAPLDRLAASIRPQGRAIGYHRWSHLLFVHWRVPAELVVPLLPPELTLDVYDGSAWIGLVPFAMRNVRPWWSPPVPGISNFLETNVRTYVHRNGRDPGVWFFSLDASSRLAVTLARRLWSLNYHHAGMSLEQQGAQLRYRSGRTARASRGHKTEIVARLSAPESELITAQPGTFDHFLLERYLLYSVRESSRGKRQLLRGQVHHTPYRYLPATLEACSESLLAANGLPQPGRPEHVAYAPGVDVEIFPLIPVQDAPFSAVLDPCESGQIGRT